MPRERLEAWVLTLSREALAVDRVATTDVIRELTSGHEVFCPQPHATERLHLVGAAFMRIARL